MFVKHINHNVEKENNLSSHLQLVTIATIILGCIVFLLKYYGYMQTKSIALFSDAMESIINIVVSIITLLAIRISILPADENHQFGHNKAEYFSTIIEGILIIIASLAILKKIWMNFETHHTDIEFNSGLIYNLAAGIIQGIIGIITYSQSKRYNSIAIRADAIHLLSDFVVTLGIIIGLIIAHYSHFTSIDPILAILISINIGWHGYKIMQESISGLMDRGADIATYKQIQEIISINALGAIEAHDLKTRVSGYLLFIEFHLIVESNMTVQTSHDICNKIEDSIKKAFPNSRITIHVEPQEEAKLKNNCPRIPVL